MKAFIVGDPNQSIYTSLGGYAISLGDLEKMTGGKFEQLSLTGNYRSSDIIINYFDYFKTFPNDIEGRGFNKEYNSIISFNETLPRASLEDEIVKLILYNVNEKNISPNEICIVAPWWVHLASLTRTLMIKLPDYSFNGPGMAPFAKDIENFFLNYAESHLLSLRPICISADYVGAKKYWRISQIWELMLLT